MHNTAVCFISVYKTIFIRYSHKHFITGFWLIWHFRFAHSIKCFHQQGRNVPYIVASQEKHSNKHWRRCFSKSLNQLIKTHCKVTTCIIKDVYRYIKWTNNFENITSSSFQKICHIIYYLSIRAEWNMAHFWCMFDQRANYWTFHIQNSGKNKTLQNEINYLDIVFFSILCHFNYYSSIWTKLSFCTPSKCILWDERLRNPEQNLGYCLNMMFRFINLS